MPQSALNLKHFSPRRSVVRAILVGSRVEKMAKLNGHGAIVAGVR